MKTRQEPEDDDETLFMIQELAGSGLLGPALEKQLEEIRELPDTEADDE